MARSPEEYEREIERLQQSNQGLSALCREAHHRIKNDLQALAGFCYLQLSTCTTQEAKDVLLSTIMRMRSIALVHQLLLQGNDPSVNILQLAEGIMGMGVQLAGDEKNLSFSAEGNALLVNQKKATDFAIVINELVSNCLKHGFKNRGSGTMRLSLSEDEHRTALLEVRDNGIGLPEGFDSERDARLGLRIVTDIVKEDLGGDIRLISQNGTRVVITFPL
ncbi:MAG: sensor histidine kinase [Nitrospirota bacterium]